jgi:hypothetical protein
MAGSDQNTGQTGPGEVQEPGGTPPPVDTPANETPANPPAGPAPAPDQPQETAPPPQPRTDWRDRRIGELTARTRELRAELERLRAGQSAPNGQGAQPRTPNGQFAPPPPDQATIDQQIQQRAEVLAANQEFNRRCNEVAEAGRRAYPDFDVVVNKLVGLVDPNDPQGVQGYNAFLNAALETGEASKVIHALGSDLNEASRILSLSPLRMAVELTRMAAKPIQELSTAPRPINPASTAAMAGRTSTSPDDPGSDQMSTAEWMRRREEQLQARNTRR